MKNKFKLLIISALVFIMTFVLVGCGNSCDHDYSAWMSHPATSTSAEYQTRTCKNCSNIEYHYEHNSTSHHTNSSTHHSQKGC